jgi:hypothetical protein
MAFAALLEERKFLRIAAPMVRYSKYVIADMHSGWSYVDS